MIPSSGDNNSKDGNGNFTELAGEVSSPALVLQIIPDEDVLQRTGNCIISPPDVQACYSAPHSAVSTLSMEKPSERIIQDETKALLVTQFCGNKRQYVELVAGAPGCNNEGKKEDLEAESKVSESGWTTYLDQRTDWSPNPASVQKKRTNLRKNYAKKLVRQDSSMASDASSGPLQDLRDFDSRMMCIAELETAELGDNHNQRCCSKTGVQNSKRRKGDQGVCPAYAKDDGETDESPCEHEDCSSNLWDTEHGQNDAVERRLKVLQHLIPNGDRFDREEMLEKAIEYVQSLEQKIKFLVAFLLHRCWMHESQSTVPQSSHCLNREEPGTLQDRGLCLMPVSSLAEAPLGAS